MKSFASDNNAGAHPEVMEALQACNRDHAIAYGDDPWTEEAIQLIQNEFGPSARAFFVFGGTAANVLALAHITQPYHAVLCSDAAHIHTDECGAPERFAGCKLMAISSVNGKLTPEKIQPYLHGFGVPHHSQPYVLSITQSTELGTVYTVEETRSLAEAVHRHGLLLHMDGARLANAAVALGASMREITVDAGVDVLALGGSKNGLMFGECVIFFNERLAENFAYIRKQGMQLYSKMRFIAAQYRAYFSEDLWKRNAAHANALAQRLAQALQSLQEITLAYPVQANAIFAKVPPHIITDLQKEYPFYVWNETESLVRWMTSFDTTEEEVDRFVGTIKRLLSLKDRRNQEGQDKAVNSG